MLYFKSIPFAKDTPSQNAANLEKNIYILIGFKVKIMLQNTA